MLSMVGLNAFPSFCDWFTLISYGISDATTLVFTSFNIVGITTKAIDDFHGECKWTDWYLKKQLKCNAFESSLISKNNDSNNNNNTLNDNGRYIKKLHNLLWFMMVNAIWSCVIYKPLVVVEFFKSTIMRKDEEFLSFNYLLYAICYSLDNIVTCYCTYKMNCQSKSENDNTANNNTAVKPQSVDNVSKSTLGGISNSTSTMQFCLGDSSMSINNASVVSKVTTPTPTPTTTTTTTTTTTITTPDKQTITVISNDDLFDNLPPRSDSVTASMSWDLIENNDPIITYI
eukprot:Pgem_evm1s2597